VNGSVSWMTSRRAAGASCRWTGTHWAPARPRRRSAHCSSSTPRTSAVPRVEPHVSTSSFITVTGTGGYPTPSPAWPSTRHGAGYAPSSWKRSTRSPSVTSSDSTSWSCYATAQCWSLRRWRLLSGPVRTHLLRRAPATLHPAIRRRTRDGGCLAAQPATVAVGGRTSGSVRVEAVRGDAVALRQRPSGQRGRDRVEDRPRGTGRDVGRLPRRRVHLRGMVRGRRPNRVPGEARSDRTDAIGGPGPRTLGPQPVDHPSTLRPALLIARATGSRTFLPMCWRRPLPGRRSPSACCCLPPGTACEKL
jgi:hypothetical protein